MCVIVYLLSCCLALHAIRLLFTLFESCDESAQLPTVSLTVANKRVVSSLFGVEDLEGNEAESVPCRNGAYGNSRGTIHSAPTSRRSCEEDASRERSRCARELGRQDPSSFVRLGEVLSNIRRLALRMGASEG